MGKMSRVKMQKRGTGVAAASVSPKEMLNLTLTGELLHKCSSPAPGPGKEWEEYAQIRTLVEKIQKKQKGLSVTFDGKRDYFPDLMKWASENGASVEGFEMVNFKEEGFGLRATRDIKAGELFLWVPRKLVMTVESAKNSVLGPLYSQDRILQAMGNIALAFHLLLCERASPISFWLPYIQTLPIFCMTEEELKESLLGENAIHRIFTLGNYEFPVSRENEVKLWSFLKDRASLHLRTYKTTEEDKAVLNNPDLPPRMKMAIKVRLGVKEILEKALQSTATKWKCFCKHMEERALLPE
ncbi:SET domain-containing protein 3 [Heterocephalus glaber]|uniref:protein-histidine N-methyltransferase n=1 Tax=Heterocephalus glaber TaxID=10181 RepID=G5AK31_HETGA|nr:SET domain-containing protein 3 [Heterocephalus glaber]